MTIKDFFYWGNNRIIWLFVNFSFRHCVIINIYGFFSLPPCNYRQLRALFMKLRGAGAYALTPPPYLRHCKQRNSEAGRILDCAKPWVNRKTPWMIKKINIGSFPMILIDCKYILTYTEKYICITFQFILSQMYFFSEIFFFEKNSKSSIEIQTKF